jgi:hypothetical protein
MPTTELIGQLLAIEGGHLWAEWRSSTHARLLAAPFDIFPTTIGIGDKTAKGDRA